MPVGIHPWLKSLRFLAFLGVVIGAVAACKTHAGSQTRATILMRDARCFLRLFRVLALMGLAFPLQTGDGRAAEGAATTNRYEFRAEHSRDGIGKFYLGREIAHVMGHQAADWLERPERDEEEHTERLVEALPVKPGDVVADIGAGTGYFSRRLAKKVGAKGKILAVDIQPEMIDWLTKTMASLKITNVEPVLGTITDP